MYIVGSIYFGVNASLGASVTNRTAVPMGFKRSFADDSCTTLFTCVSSIVEKVKRQHQVSPTWSQISEKTEDRPSWVGIE